MNGDLSELRKDLRLTRFAGGLAGDSDVPNADLSKT